LATNLTIVAGMRFGRLTLRQKARQSPKVSPTIRVQWIADCDCGKRITVPQYYLVRQPNPKVNCGDCHDLKTNKTRHNEVYRCWLMMLKRCNDPRHVSYKHYGGRGIKVCEEWSDPVTGFDAFLAFIGPRPDMRYSIDRVDVNVGYQPYHNGKIQVKWSTAQEQAANKRPREPK
jgi:hypothetical protein